MVKRALIIGINYSNKKFKLKAPPQDANDFEAFLKNKYPDVLIIKLLNLEATKVNCIACFEFLISETQPGDVLFFYFSGHGTQIPDDNGDEVDGKDEAILPADAVDFTHRATLIVDDDLANEIRRLPVGSIFVAVVDTCHSSSIFDLEEAYLSMASKIVSLPTDRIPNNFAADIRVFSSSKDSEQSFEDDIGGIFTRNFISTSKGSSSVQDQLILLTKRLDKIQSPTLSLSQGKDWLNKPFLP